MKTDEKKVESEKVEIKVEAKVETKVEIPAKAKYYIELFKGGK